MMYKLTENHSRLRWKCRRGMRELDLLLLAFLEQRYDPLAPHEQECFEHLLEYPDQILFDWLMGKATPADTDVAQLVTKIRNPAAA